jgi:hypothetical protein
MEVAQQLYSCCVEIEGFAWCVFVRVRLGRTDLGLATRITPWLLISRLYCGSRDPF